MADAMESVSTLNGLFKEVYADGIKDLVPNGTKIQQKIPFIRKEKELGKTYNQPVILSYCAGFTYAAPNSGAYSLNDTIPGTMKNASVDGYQMLLREQMDYESAAKSARGRNAFVDGTQLLFENMQKSFRKRLEHSLLYGGSGIAQVSSYSSPTITLNASYFAPGIWAGAEGSSVDVYNGSTKRGTDTIASVDVENYTITLATGVSGTASGDKIYWTGSYGNEMSGIYSILTNSGSLFGISAASYTLWKTPQYANGGKALNFAGLRKAISKAVGKGGLDEDVSVFVNPKTWDNLLDDLASLRRLGADDQGKSKSSKYVVGASEIEFFSQNGRITIIPSIYIWEGFALGLTTEYWKRPGAQDVSFNTPGYGEQIFFHIPTRAGFEVRAFTDQAVFSEAPAKNFLITGIVNA
jgi:hypothetical protein